MEEKEIKIILKIDLDEFKKRILKEGYQLLGSKKQVDVYYDNANFDLYKKVAALRIRNGKTLAYKKLLYPKRKWFIQENEIPYMKGMEDIIIALGYKPQFVIQKDRFIFKKGDVEIDMDNVKDLGILIELECENSDPLAEVNKLLKQDEWERTVEGLSNLWLRVKKGLNMHLNYIEKFEKNPEWNL